ncbi:MAG: NAD(+) synthase [Erysipelotrichaceae bacterium]
MKIALGQIEVFAGQPTKNYLAIEKMVNAAKKNNVDLIVFPEQCVAGYMLADKWCDDEWVRFVISFNDKIKDLSDNIAIVWGSVTTDDCIVGRDGRMVKFNSALFAYQGNYVKRSNGEVAHYIKHLQPDYNVFNESRYFTSAIEYAQYEHINSVDLLAPYIFDFNGLEYQIGLEVCEDLFSENYSTKVTDIYNQQKVDMIINVSSSPYSHAKEKTRIQEIINSGYQGLFIYSNCVSAQNNGKNLVLFDGNSMIFDQGSLVCLANDSFQSELKIYENKEEYKANDDKLLQALLYGLKSFDQEMFNAQVNWIIGLSGGIDSSISAALLTMALGANRVKAYNLPSKFNTTKTIESAELTAKALKIEYQSVEIEPLVQTTINTIKQTESKELNSLAIENIYARIRGHLLSSFASNNNGVIINNGNKVELALGYCTLYGDLIGAIAPLGDLSKIELFALAKQINKYFAKDVISTKLIPTIKHQQLSFDISPSAELAENQQDPMKWGYHDLLIKQLLSYPNMQLEKLLQSYLDQSIYDSEIGSYLKVYNLTNGQAFIEDLEWVLKLLKRNVFKRIQAPPIIALSECAFGWGYLENQANYEVSQKYLELREKIMNKGYNK